MLEAALKELACEPKVFVSGGECHGEADQRSLAQRKRYSESSDVTTWTLELHFLGCLELHRSWFLMSLIPRRLTCVTYVSRTFTCYNCFHLRLFIAIVCFLAL